VRRSEPPPRGNGFPSYPATVRRPAPGGIQARSKRGGIGETWWSRRFIAVLESFSMGPRLNRGRSYARSGQVLDLVVSPGLVVARVQGSRVRPYRVEIGAAPLSEKDWRRAEDAMASQAIFLATLLAGEMPPSIEEAFAECRLSLFPARPRDLRTSCSCPDWANPCKHVAAALYILAEKFDEDPFLIFAWRGRPKEVLLENLRLLRADPEEDGVEGEPSAADEEAPPLEDCLDRFWEAGVELTSLRMRPRAAEAPDALVRQLDPPRVRVRGRDLLELLGPAYREMAAGAERRAMGVEDEPGTRG
jgi:uncharacterized Zn finger protein